MPCAPGNRRRTFSYHTKMADFEYFRVLSVFSWKIWHKLRKVYWIWQVAVVTSINCRRPERAELPDVNINTGVHLISLFLVFVLAVVHFLFLATISMIFHFCLCSSFVRNVVPGINAYSFMWKTHLICSYIYSSNVCTRYISAQNVWKLNVNWPFLRWRDPNKTTQ